MSVVLRAAGTAALAGAVIAAAVAVATLLRVVPLTVIDVLLLTGSLVVVPLGLGLVRPIGPAQAMLVGMSRWLVVPAALVAVAAMVLPRGLGSAVVASPWLLAVIPLGLAALIRLVRRRIDDIAELGQVAASAFLVVGAAFLVIDRGGLRPFDFPQVIIQLTAVHFTYTGFGLLFVAVAAARWVATGPLPRRPAAANASILTLIAGMLVTPVGFLGLPALQLAGVTLVLASLSAVAIVGLSVSSQLPTGARPWIWLSSIAATAVGALAAIYAVSEALGGPMLDIETMSRVHGVLGAIGLVIPGLLGWRVAAIERLRLSSRR